MNISEWFGRAANNILKASVRDGFRCPSDEDGTAGILGAPLRLAVMGGILSSQG